MKGNQKKPSYYLPQKNFPPFATSGQLIAYYWYQSKITDFLTNRTTPVTTHPTMKKILLGCLFLLTLVQACRKDNDTISTGLIPTENVKSSLIGRVTDENGNPVANALVLLESANAQKTDAKGRFFYHNQTLNKNGAYIKVEKAGYFTSTRFSFHQVNGTTVVEVQLIPKKLVSSFNAASGGQFSFDDGAEVTIPANALALPTGELYTGTVKAFAVWLDPSKQRTFDQMPGDLRAIDANGDAKALTTYGMIGVELETDYKEKLHFIPNQKAKIALTVPNSMLNTAPATIPLWHFDESYGYWKEEGSATLNNGRYEGEVSHFSFWNCDIASKAVLLTGSVVDNAGNPLSNATVRLVRHNLTPGEGPFRDAITGGMGYFGGLVPANEVFTLLVLDQCGQWLYASEIGPFTENTTLAPISITSPDVITVSGKAVDCNNNPLSEGTIIVESVGGNKTLLVGFTPENGEFSFSLFNCTALTEVAVTAYDLENLYQSTSYTAPIINHKAEVGVLTTCNLPDEYIHVIIGEMPQMLMINPTYYYDFNSNEYRGFISGVNSDSTRIGFNFYEIINNQAEVFHVEGSYKTPSSSDPIKFGCYVASADCPDADPDPIIFTKVPMVSGEYAEGTTSGSVVISGVLQNYTVSFRIKK